MCIIFGQEAATTHIMRVAIPVEPFFKTESEVATMDYVRKHTSLPVPRVLAYDSSTSNQVGFEWIVMDGRGRNSRERMEHDGVFGQAASDGRVGPVHEAVTGSSIHLVWKHLFCRHMEPSRLHSTILIAVRLASGIGRHQYRHRREVCHWSGGFHAFVQRQERNSTHRPWTIRERPGAG